MDNKTHAHIVGETLAKLHFELEGYFVYTNSSGKAEFDFLLSRDSILYAVEVKTVSILKQNASGEDYFECQLKSVRANTKENTIHQFDNSILDFLVIVNLVDNKVKVIKASDVVAKSALRVYRKDF